MFFIISLFILLFFYCYYYVYCYCFLLSLLLPSFLLLHYYYWYVTVVIVEEVPRYGIIKCVCAIFSITSLLEHLKYSSCDEHLQPARVQSICNNQQFSFYNHEGFHSYSTKPYSKYQKHLEIKCYLLGF